MSPYEALLLADPIRRVGLWAGVPEETAAAPEVPADHAEQLAALGLADFRLATCRLPGRRLACAYLTTRDDPDGALVRLGALPWWPALAWRRMELINLVAHRRVFPHRGRRIRRRCLVAGLRNECEAAYRSLHQTNWPGVVEQMVRSNHREWTTFLDQDADGLLLFTTVEWSGEDLAADQAATCADPVTRRWWLHTEPCLRPLVPGGGTWAEMEVLAGLWG